jgi:phage terminase large subunit-like protein
MSSGRKVQFKDKELYRERLHSSAEEYEKDVLSGKQTAPKTIKLAVEREIAARKKFDYKKEEVDKVFNFCYYIYINIKSQVTQFVPSAYQAWIIRALYGTFRKNSKKRLRRFAVLTTGRKSGKTVLMAILALYGLTKGEREAEVYFAATTQFQAGQALRYLKNIVANSPALKKRVDVLQYSLRYKGNGICTAKPLANNAEKLDGLSPYTALIDEAAALEDKSLFNVLKTGTLARENPLIIQISTANTYKEYPFFQELETGRGILNGKVEDDSTFYAIYMLDEEDDQDDVDVWVKANPNIGVTIDVDDLIVDFNKAKLTVTDLREFYIKNLNIYSDKSVDTWIPDDVYKECQIPVDITALKGMDAYMALDLSATRDFSSLVIVVETPDGKINVIPEFFLPMEPKKSVRSDYVDLSVWLKSGFIHQSDKRVIDHDQVFDRIEFWLKYFNIIDIAFDRAGATQLKNRISTELDFDCRDYPQNPLWFNPAMKHIEMLMFQNNINMSDNPVLRWMFRNAMIFTDSNGNIKTNKSKSLDSIDGVVALIMAIGCLLNINHDFIHEAQEAYINKYKNQ